MTAEACEKLKALGLRTAQCKLLREGRWKERHGTLVRRSWRRPGHAVHAIGSPGRAGAAPAGAPAGARGASTSSCPAARPGESVTLTEERAEARHRDHDGGGGRQGPVLAGAGGNDTRVAIERAQRGRRRGRRRHAVRGALLQQAHARGLLPALLRDRRRQHRARRSSTTCPAGPAATSTPRRSCAWRVIPTSPGVKEASGNLGQVMEILRDRPRASRFSRATTP